MAVSTVASSVIIRNCTIEARLPGGMAAFEHSCPNQTFCTDGSISRVSFMLEADARSLINQLVAAGLVSSREELVSEIALVFQEQGFAYPCDWLQLGLFDGRPCAWLANTDRGNLFIPRGDLTGEIVAYPVEEFRQQFELIGLKSSGKVEVYRHKLTGEVRYVGRPFNPVRKWWQFWNRFPR
jgi:hypothetical protein